MTELRLARKNAGLERKFVAEELGVSPDHLNLIERGKTQLNLTRIAKMANLYKIAFGSMAEIAYRTYKNYREGNGYVRGKRENIS